jgi:hypothetical protein
MTVRAGLWPAVGAVLGIALAAGCSASAGSPGSPGSRGAGTATAPSAGSSGATAGPSSGAAGPAGSGSPGGNGQAVPGGTGSAPQAGCTAWPAGSSRTILSITAGSDGQTYCVRTGQTVQVVLSGSLALADGAQPPRLTGDALAAGPVRQSQMMKMPAQSYTAVRPGTSVLTIVRLPCHSPQSMQGSPPAAAGLAGTAISVAAATARAAGASPAALLSFAVGGGGVPVGTNCGAQQVLHVFIVVT